MSIKNWKICKNDWRHVDWKIGDFWLSIHGSASLFRNVHEIGHIWDWNGNCVSNTRFRIFLSEIDKDSTNRAFLCIRNWTKGKVIGRRFHVWPFFSIEEFIDRFIKYENISFFKFILPLSSNFKRIFFLYFFSIKNYLLLYSKHKIYFEECYRNFYIYLLYVTRCCYCIFEIRNRRISKRSIAWNYFLRSPVESIEFQSNLLFNRGSLDYCSIIYIDSKRKIYFDVVEIFQFIIQQLVVQKKIVNNSSNRYNSTRIFILHHFQRSTFTYWLDR